MSESTLMPTYARLDVAFESGQGVWLNDTQGEQYLDAISGIGVCNLGHGHPAVTEALCGQAKKLIHTSNLYGIPNQQALADKLIAISGMEKAFIANSGAEANEAAIKLARLHGHRKNIELPTIIVAEHSFHGRTMATLTASGNRKVQAGFEPLVRGFVRAPFNDIAALENIAKNNTSIAAILIEPIQGEGGIHIADDEYLRQVRALCDQHDWLMMLDEIQSGLCRNGKWFTYQHAKCLPDVLTSAKALGNGMPIGACLVRDKAASLFGPGNHGSTFGGNPLACKVALEVLNVLEQENLAEQARNRGQYLTNRLNETLQQHETVKEIRGRGLMMGVELNYPCGHLVQDALDAKLLINVTAERVIRLLPPLIISEQECDIIADTLAKIIPQRQDAGAA